ncbi:HET domain-containing protein [Apiospora aurea]|uniref:HET domain-containing protein n=1 Tax=Apiospora aurea TaxID=335848 RepID=A0ABR1QUV9_9PEZI
MRLINTKTFLLESIYTQVPYATLSHTWGPEEISFQEWEVVHDSGAIQGQCPHTQKMSRPNITRKKGYEKVIGACQQAARDGIQYLWCDTNCIDKTSSAELSEAINSMFAWYRDSRVCYVILTDVQVPTATSLRGHKSYAEGWFTRQQKTKRQNMDVWESFQNSRWWTRGWTLQELLAPKDLVFFARDWSPLGNKANLSEWILKFTTIHRRALHDASSIPTFSIAQRMSWASDRRTTVPEDMAYCLLGIFDINMPMLYGQGHKAFLKLQEEIIKVSDDHSILAWDRNDPNMGPTAGLATSPVAFKYCGDISRCEYFKHLAYSVTNLGISIRLEVMKTNMPEIVLAGLGCGRLLHHPSDQNSAPENRVPKEFRIWIPLLTTGHRTDNRWLRAHAPFSKVFLDHQYQLMGNVTFQDLFISTEFRFENPPISKELRPVHDHQSPEPSGFLVRIGFGDIDHIRVYLEVYDFREFISVALRRRRPQDMSHQLVSSGRFSILLSAVWDADGRTVSTNYTVVPTRAASILAGTKHEDAWAALYDRNLQRVQTMDEVCIRLSALHGKFREHFSSKHGEKCKEDWPLVQTSKGRYLDFRGRSELVVDVIFKDRAGS